MLMLHVFVQGVDALTMKYEDLLFAMRYIHFGDEPTLYCENGDRLYRFVCSLVYCHLSTSYFCSCTVYL